jgi:hypothetical protein
MGGLALGSAPFVMAAIAQEWNRALCMAGVQHRRVRTALSAWYCVHASDLSRRYLAQGGNLVQWIQAYGLKFDDLVLSLVITVTYFGRVSGCGS